MPFSQNEGLLIFQKSYLHFCSTYMHITYKYCLCPYSGVFYEADYQYFVRSQFYVSFYAQNRRKNRIKTGPIWNLALKKNLKELFTKPFIEHPSTHMLTRINNHFYPSIIQCSDRSSQILCKYYANIRIFNEIMPNLHKLTYNVIKLVIHFFLYLM